MQPAILLLIVFFLLINNTTCFEYGRATFYGDEPWWWPIHGGSCGFGYQCKNQGTGWDVAALSDKHPDYAGSCGRCYEVFCHPSILSDNYGAQLDRTEVCRNTKQSVVVTIVDTCPCIYAQNYYSNKRWCCGDMKHFDLSVWAFEKLSERRWGVMGIKYRPVNCNHTPWKKAPVPPEGEFWGQPPSHYGESCPKNNAP
eukprot:TRINITY_DN196_c1_g1_i1.p2 TRINITY_DN196_c1_g1~~TRINITY_DN196_c1_g1_i1.p2  ORF type:complete len:198 (-),score=35.25 TRINITY_DN196_c1_g1_i1:307-900(-)